MQAEQITYIQHQVLYSLYMLYKVRSTKLCVQYTYTLAVLEFKR